MSAFYRKSVTETQDDKKADAPIPKSGPTQIAENSPKEASQTKHEIPQTDIFKKFKDEIHKQQTKEERMTVPEDVVNDEPVDPTVQSNESENLMDVDIDTSASRSAHTQENLERRLKIDEEVTFVRYFKSFIML